MGSDTFPGHPVWPLVDPEEFSINKSDDASTKFVKTLKGYVILYSGFKFILEYGPLSEAHLILYVHVLLVPATRPIVRQGFTSPQASVLSSLPALVLGHSGCTIVTDEGPLEHTAFDVFGTVKGLTSFVVSTVDPRVRFCAITHNYALVDGSLSHCLPSSTMLTRLRTPLTNAKMRMMKNKEANIALGTLRHRAWFSTLRKTSTIVEPPELLAADSAFLHVQSYIDTDDFRSRGDF